MDIHINLRAASAVVVVLLLLATFLYYRHLIFLQLRGYWVVKEVSHGNVQYWGYVTSSLPIISDSVWTQYVGTAIKFVSEKDARMAIRALGRVNDITVTAVYVPYKSLASDLE